MKKSTFYKLLPLALILFLALSNPQASHFQNALVEDFGQFHGGVSIDTELLMELGHGNRDSYFLFSIYQYEMGNIGVRYWGIAGQTFFRESYRKDGSSPSEESYEVTTI